MHNLYSLTFSNHYYIYYLFRFSMHIIYSFTINKLLFLPVILDIVLLSTYRMKVSRVFAVYQDLFYLVYANNYFTKKYSLKISYSNPKFGITEKIFLYVYNSNPNQSSLNLNNRKREYSLKIFRFVLFDKGCMLYYIVYI